MAEGSVTVGGQKVNCKADFGSDRVLFSGGRRGEVPYKSIQVLGTGKGLLRLRVDGALMEFHLGDKVERIAQKIRSPPGRLDKMGVKPGLAAAVVDVDDAAFLAELRKKCPTLHEGAPAAQVDLLVLGVKTVADLGDIATLRRHLTPTGGIWVVFRKGNRDLRDTDVIEGGRAAGLKDVKVMRFSETQTALKFVIPLAGR